MNDIIAEMPQRRYRPTFKLLQTYVLWHLHYVKKYMLLCPNTDTWMALCWHFDSGHVFLDKSVKEEEEEFYLP